MAKTALQEALDQHSDLKGLLKKYPSQAAPLSQTLIDLTHASKWQHLCVIDTAPNQEPGQANPLGRAVVIGLRPEANGLEAVWCCSISDMLNSATFHDIFAVLDGLTLSVVDEAGKQLSVLRSHFIIAVYSPDATVVYYNMARGLVKPVN